jgi:predicted kinase
VSMTDIESKPSIGSATMKTLTVMRGLPWSGKSYRAKELAEELEATILSTDDYWYEVNHPEKPDEYSFNRQFLPGAHKWNQLRAARAIERGESIIIDNTNTTASEPKPYIEHAHFCFPDEYKFCIEEPTSERWLEIRQLLYDKKSNKKELKKWAATLAEGSKETHNVPHFAIERMMWRWQCDLTVDQILTEGDKG